MDCTELEQRYNQLLPETDAPTAYDHIPIRDLSLDQFSNYIQTIVDRIETNRNVSGLCSRILRECSVSRRSVYTEGMKRSEYYYNAYKHRLKQLVDAAHELFLDSMDQYETFGDLPTDLDDDDLIIFPHAARAA